MLPDYYAVLGIPSSASNLEIKAAFRTLAKQHHPDKHQGDTDQENIFKAINEAYSVLSHTDTKFAYDKQFMWRDYPSPDSRPQPHVYRAPATPYNYAPRTSTYANSQYKYSKWTLMYGKIFVISLILLVTLAPVFLEYSFSNYYYNKGLAALSNKDYFEADDNFSNAMRGEMGGSSTIAAIKGAELKLAFNSNFQALVYISNGLDYAKSTRYRARLYYLRGIAKRNLRKMQDADQAFQTAMKLNYNKDSIYSILAPIYAYELKKYPSAIITYDSLIRYHPDNFDHYLNRGFCYQKNNKHELAIADFNQFINNKGINGSVLFLKAISELALNQMDSSCINFYQAKSLGISNAATYIRIYCEKDTTKAKEFRNPF